MSREINIDNIFIDAKNNINDEIIINKYIDIISQNFYNIDYNNFIRNIINLLDDINFIIIFLNKLCDNKIVKKNYKFIIKDIITNINNKDIIKNLFLLDIVDYTIFYDIINKNQLDNKDMINIYDFIFEIGKIDIIIDLLDNIIIDYKAIEYKNLIKILLSLLKFHKKIINTDFYKDISSNLSTIIYVLLPLFELKQLSQKLTNNTEEPYSNENVDIIFDFLDRLIINYDKFFNVYIIDNIFELFNFLVKLKIDINPYITIIDNIYKLLLTNVLNIHEKAKLFNNIAKILEYSDYVPKDLILYIDYYITNINFLTWSTLDEKIIIMEYISKLLLRLNLNNKLCYDNYDKYDNVLYNILYLESESFNILKNLLNSIITYTDYNLIKNVSYNLISIINIFNDVQYKYFDYCKQNKMYYGDLLHKNNILLNTYLLYFADISQNINRFNCSLFFNSIIINKIMLIYKHTDYKFFPLNSIEYEILEDYYKINNINLYNFLIIIDKIKDKDNKSNDFITKNNDTEYIDNIFSIEIRDPIMIPKSNDFFERSTMYLLIRESHKHPYTREELSLPDLIKYNMRDDIKNKINDFLIKKNNL